MTLKISNSHEVDILGCRVRRECDYESLIADCMLHIDEVEDMLSLGQEDPLETAKLYWITVHDEDTSHPKTFTRKWFEFSVTSNVADKAFEENVDLEVGEEAKWNPLDLVEDGMLWPLNYPMSQIVVQGDGLGFWNEESRPDQEYQGADEPHEAGHITKSEHPSVISVDGVSENSIFPPRFHGY